MFSDLIQQPCPRAASTLAVIARVSRLARTAGLTWVRWLSSVGLVGRFGGSLAVRRPKSGRLLCFALAVVLVALLVAAAPALGADRVYWTNLNNNTISSNPISFANLDNTGGGGQLKTTGAAPSEPAFLALLKLPSGAGAPRVSGGSRTGSKLSCSRGVWAADLLGAFLFRAPHSYTYRWTRNGSKIPGANSNTTLASSPGSYTCTVTAGNAAGSNHQHSAPFTVGAAGARITKAKISSKHHTAKFSFKAIGTASGFQCALAKKRMGKHKTTPKPKYRFCRSPKTYKHLKRGRYTFYVRALSAGAPGTVASKNFKIS